MNFLRRLVLVSAIFSALSPLVSASAQTQGTPVTSQPSVFQMPVLREGQQRVQGYLAAGQPDQAIKVLDNLVSVFPGFSELHFAKAVINARAGRKEAAINDIEAAAGLGFSDTDRLLAEPSFAALRLLKDYAALLEQIRANPPARAEEAAAEPTLVRDGVAAVSELNTSLEPRTNTLQTQFRFQSRLFAEPKVSYDKTLIADRLNDLYRSGKGAGNLGDLYDNRDRKHSSLNREKFPQVGFVEYPADAKQLNLDFSFNDKIFFSAPTVGNASLGLNGMWSIAKAALTSQRSMAIAYLQYRTDHLYVYPSVRDYAWPEYKMDNFAANTPFFIISQGKSGSDRPFLEAAFVALAALPPAVKEYARSNGLVASTLQMLLRRSQSHIVTQDDYLSPKAHPSVFDGSRLDLSRAIDLAQQLNVENLPPRVEFAVLAESSPSLRGGSSGSDVLFTTPSAVSRIVSKQGEGKSFTVSMAATRIQDTQEARYHWRVLEGNPDLISITPQNETRSVAVLDFKWHPRQTSLSNPDVQTDRADIGMFVEVDGVISAPAIVSVYFQKD